MGIPPTTGLSPTRGRGFGKTTSLPLLIILVWPFYPLLWRSCSDSFQVFFIENCSVYSYRFGMPMGRGKFSIFLCCHLELPPQTSPFLFGLDSTVSIVLLLLILCEHFHYNLQSPGLCKWTTNLKNENVQHTGYWAHRKDKRKPKLQTFFFNNLKLC